MDKKSTAASAPASEFFTAATVRITASRRSGVADDRIAIKASAPLADLSSSPTVGGISVSLRDGAGNEIYAAHLPEADISNSGGNGLTFKFRDTKGVYPTANGVISATIKRVSGAGTARLNLKARGIDFASFSGIGSVAMSLLVGVNPASGDCLSAPAVACSSSPASLRCAN